MTEPTTKPLVRYSILDGDGAEGPTLTARGRDAWLLLRLIERGERGVTAFDEVGPRLSHYAYKLRGAGVAIETKDEPHGGAFAGHHGRYVLRSRIKVHHDEVTPAMARRAAPAWSGASQAVGGVA